MTTPEASAPLAGVTPGRAREPRWHALDTLRAAAMASVLISHGSLAYIHHRIPGLLWLVHDPSDWLVFDVLFHWTRVAVPLFFALSGFFAVLIHDAKGPTGFLKDRARRILTPLLVGLLTVLPLSLWVWAYGWFRSGRCSDRQFLRLVFSDPELRSNRLGTGHLWFLVYALGYLAIYAACRHLTRHRPRPQADEPTPRWGRALLSPLAPLALTLPTALILWLTHEPNGIDALLNRRNAFLPEPSRFLYYGLFFAFGVALHRIRGDLDRLRPWAWTYLGVSLLAFAGRFAHLMVELPGTPATNGQIITSSFLGALTCWTSVYALLGVAQRYATRESARARYLADASYWVYWCHMPILGLLEVHLLPMPWPQGLKFVVVVAVTGAWTLATYQVFVRHTAIGRWLHGPRQRRNSPAPGVKTHPGGEANRPARRDRPSTQSVIRQETR
ncbi:MAG: acyltransferase family protein [Isosphaeraceae bacterium]